ncbi:MAG TPA: alkaline phosphatase family protein, partial [Acidothermaceae bacterium]
MRINPRRLTRHRIAATTAALLGTALALALPVAASAAPPAPTTPTSNTTTPIKHLVVIFQENVSFDHYFGTYPTAPNT